MNYRDRRGSWAAKWGQQGPRYHRATRPRLSGVAPVRSWAQRMRGVQRVDHFAPLPYPSLRVAHRWPAQPVVRLGRAGYAPHYARFGGRSGGRWDGTIGSAAAPYPRRWAGGYQSTDSRGSWQSRAATPRLHGAKISWRGLAPRHTWRQGGRISAHAARAGTAARISAERKSRPVAPVRRRDPAVSGEPIFSLGSVPPRQLVNLSAEHDRLASQRLGLDDLQGLRAGGQRHDPYVMPVDHGFTGGGHVGSSRSGEAMMRWFGQLFGDEARRPPSGPTRADTMLSPIFPGRKPGF